MKVRVKMRGSGAQVDFVDAELIEVVTDSAEEGIELDLTCPPEGCASPDSKITNYDGFDRGHTLTLRGELNDDER